MGTPVPRSGAVSRFRANTGIRARRCLPASRNWKVAMNKVFSVAIDGPCGAGKSTVSDKVAERLHCVHLDTGAMYRAVGLYMLRNGVPLDDAQAIAARVGEANIGIRYENGVQRTLLNGEDVTGELRKQEASAASSAVAKVLKVRERMVETQREIAQGISLLMDGRDIGTCVLTDATLKVYLTASAEERARRRYEQSKDANDGVAPQTLDEVLADILARDKNDTTREFSPLRKADDAVVVDSTNMTQDEVVDEIVRLLKSRTEG